MHNPCFPRIRPLALSLLLACGAGASLPAVAGITCVVEHSEDGTQDTGGANTGTEDDRTTMAMNTAGLAGANRIGVGVGGQNGESALAVGYQRAIGNRASISIGAAFGGGESSMMGGAGFSW